MFKFPVPSAAAPPLAPAARKPGGRRSLSSLDFVSAIIGNIANAPPIILPANINCGANRNIERPWIEQRDYKIEAGNI